MRFSSLSAWIKMSHGAASWFRSTQFFAGSAPQKLFFVRLLAADIASLWVVL
jgi:hypothetical protein